MILKAAQSYAAAGIACFPCNKDKSPATKNGFKNATTSADWLSANWNGAPMIGVPMGEIVCLDIDAKHKPGLVADFEFCCEQLGLTELLTRLPKQLTPSGGGAHYLFKPPSEIRNSRLAKNKDKETIIETRGAGGYICVAPSKGYSFERGGLLEVPRLTQEEVDALFDVARSFSEIAIKEKADLSVPIWKRKDAAGNKPGDDYNRRGDVVSLLRSHGWTSSNGTHWTRPGKDSGISATLGKVEGKFYVFSSNASPFEPETSYSPFAVYATLEHSGDFSAATKALADEGYGEDSLPEVSAEMQKIIADLIANETAKREYSWAAIDAEIQEAKAHAKEQKKEEKKFIKALLSIAANDDENIAAMKQRAQEARFVLPGVALQGDLTIINGAPNAGKTLVTLWLLKERDRVEGQHVFYLNCDDSFNGSIEKMHVTNRFDVMTLIPGQKGFSPAQLESIVTTAIKEDACGDVVLVLDTLKKFVDTMSKTEARKFNLLLSAFRQAGGTVIALAHTNKHKDGDGKSVYEGVGDFDSDFDCCYNLELETAKDEPNRIVTFENRKLRGPNEMRVSFKYQHGRSSWAHKFNSIERLDSDAAEKARRTAEIELQRADDASVIDFIKGKLKDAPQSRTTITQNDPAKPGDEIDTGSRKRREDVLDRYGPKCKVAGYQIWGESRGQNGARNYYLLNKNDERSNLVGLI